ncbi:hypothetical protein Tco_0164433, partial [Tanacetum coccineum]
VNTPGSDENSLKLYDLIADMKGSSNGRDLKFTSEDQVKGGLLGNRLMETQEENFNWKGWYCANYFHSVTAAEIPSCVNTAKETARISCLRAIQRAYEKIS